MGKCGYYVYSLLECSYYDVLCGICRSKIVMCVLCIHSYYDCAIGVIMYKYGYNMWSNMCTQLLWYVVLCEYVQAWLLFVLYVYIMTMMVMCVVVYKYGYYVHICSNYLEPSYELLLLTKYDVLCEVMYKYGYHVYSTYLHDGVVWSYVQVFAIMCALWT